MRSSVRSRLAAPLGCERGSSTLRWAREVRKPVCLRPEARGMSFIVKREYIRTSIGACSDGVHPRHVGAADRGALGYVRSKLVLKTMSSRLERVGANHGLCRGSDGGGH